MGRRPNPQRREELLDEILAYVQENGLANLSLRPLASSLGTSTYTLTYQFGSKKELLSSILEELRRRERRAPHNAEPMPLAERVETVWRFVQTPEGRAFHRLRLEGVAATMLDGHHEAAPPATVSDLIGIGATIDLTDRGDGPDPAGATSDPLIATRREGGGEGGNGETDLVTEATLVWATVEGLILDYLASGDTARIDTAVRALADDVRTRSAVTS